MTTLIRQAGAVWKGDLRNGKGVISTESMALSEVPYSFSTRFENEPGTNPEELIAGAHAACYAMAFASTLAKKGYKPESIDVHAACVLEKQESGFAITRMKLRARGVVPDIDAETFAAVSKEADKGCPVSNLLRPGVIIEHETELLS
ncbi:MAG: OsmC family protein [Anaerolineae bacterium]|jgi:osmotically inducible protein OsmC